MQPVSLLESRTWNPTVSQIPLGPSSRTGGAAEVKVVDRVQTLD